MTLGISYDESSTLMNGLPNTIAQYDIPKGKRSKADVPTCTVKLAIRIKNNINQIPELDRVEMTEHWTEEEKIPIKTGGGKVAPPKEEKKADAPAAEGEQPAAAEEPKPEAPAEEQKYEIKQRKKERTTNIAFKTISHAIPPDQKVQFRGLEEQLMIEDRKILDLKEAKYMLESFTYEMKNGLDQYGNLEHFIDPTLKAAYQENLAATEAWIYAEGENAPLEDQRSRLEALKAIGLPVKNRYHFRADFPSYVGLFQKAERGFQERMGEVAHLTEEQRTSIVEKCALMQQYYMDLQSQIENKPKHDDLTATLADVENKQMLFEAEVNSILSTPPPAPKKEEEKKAEEPAAADGEKTGDAEMKDEGAAAAEDSNA